MTNLFLEYSLLKTALFNPELRDYVFDISADVFFEKRPLYERLRKLHLEDRFSAAFEFQQEILDATADIYSEVEEIEKGGKELKNLLNCREIHQKTFLLQKFCVEGNIDGVVNELDKILIQFNDTSMPMEVSAGTAIEDLENDIQSGQMITCIKSGFPETIDKNYGGFAIGKVTTWAGYSRNGKSTIWQSSFNANEEDENVVYYMATTEVAPKEMWLNIACDRLGIGRARAIQGHISEAEKQQLLGLTAELKERYENKKRLKHTRSTEVLDILSSAKRFFNRYGGTKKRVLVLDFVNKCTIAGKPATSDPSSMQTIQTVISNFAEQHDVCVLQFCQFNEDRKTRKKEDGDLPRMSDIYFGNPIVVNSFALYLLFLPERTDGVSIGTYEDKKYMPAWYRCVKNKAGGQLIQVHTAFDKRDVRYIDIVRDDFGNPFIDYYSAADYLVRKEASPSQALPNQAAIDRLDAHFNPPPF